MQTRVTLTFTCALAAIVAAGCGRSECTLDDPDSCGSSQICESVVGQEKPSCFDPVQLEGRVFDSASAAAVAGASVTALDENGAPAGEITLSSSSGAYTLRIPSIRADATGTPVARKVLLRVSAK